MGQILLILVLVATGVVTLAQPWIGVLAGYLVSIMGPQFIWFWVFDGIRPFFWILIPTFLGWIFATVGGRLKLVALNTATARLFMIWWAATGVSYLLGPYVEQAESPTNLFTPSGVFASLTIQFGFMFIAMTALSNARHIRYAIYMISFIGVYMSYWINDQYLSGISTGRFGGPSDLAGSSLYVDENAFALLFVIICPYLFYLGLYIRQSLVRYGLWLVIPFAWHGIFLTGSRGGLLGLAAVLVIVTLRMRRVGAGLLVFALFGIAFAWQGGDVMKSRAETISSYEEDYAATSRLEAWEAAISMIASHPITGVGVAAFVTAFSDHAPYTPRATHNTFFEIAAESGIIAGAAWIGILIAMFASLNRSIRRLRESPPDDDDARIASYAGEATLAALVGFAVCSVFLSLKGYEVFFFLAVVANSLNIVTLAWGKEKGAGSRCEFPKRIGEIGDHPKLEPNEH